MAESYWIHIFSSFYEWLADLLHIFDGKIMWNPRFADLLHIFDGIM